MIFRRLQLGLSKSSFPEKHVHAVRDSTSFRAERQAGSNVNTDFITSCGLTRLGIEPEPPGAAA